MDEWLEAAYEERTEFEDFYADWSDEDFEDFEDYHGAMDVD